MHSICRSKINVRRSGGGALHGVVQKGIGRVDQKRWTRLRAQSFDVPDAVVFFSQDG